MRKFIIMALLSVYAFSLTVSDIEVMRKSGVLVAFPNESKAHTISKNIKPSKLITISYIRLNNQSLYFVPSWLPKMTNLVKLELKNTKLNLKELAKLKTLTKLNTLDISDNPLFKKGGSLVDVLSVFSLSELYLSNTGGSSSDYNNTGSLKSLIKLDLSDNTITYISDLGLQNLTRLKELSLANNNIGGTFGQKINGLDTKYLPKESLVKLDLSGNKIEKFGFSGDFPALHKFNISNNKCYMEFVEEYNNPYLFSNLEQGKFSSYIVLPESIMSRLGIKHIKGIDRPKINSVCKSNGGKIDNGVCEAEWENAKKICYTSGGRLPTLGELIKILINCDGEIVEYNDKKNTENIEYQTCYKRKGFLTPNFDKWYWSFEKKRDIVNFYNGRLRGNFLDVFSNYVSCVREK